MTPALILVLGMHRSGTSVTASLIDAAGASVGRSKMAAKQDNLDGFFENEAIVEFHDALLHRLGTSWDDPSPVSNAYFTSKDCDQDAKALVTLINDEFPTNSHWLIKDPRIGKLPGLWQKVIAQIDRPVVSVLTLRSARGVARSLFTRNAISPQRAFELCQTYTAGNFLLWSGIEAHHATTFEHLTLNTNAQVNQLTDFLTATLPDTVLPDPGALGALVHQRTVGTPPVAELWDIDPEQSITQSLDQAKAFVSADMTTAALGLDVLFPTLTALAKDDEALALESAFLTSSVEKIQSYIGNVQADRLGQKAHVQHLTLQAQSLEEKRYRAELEHEKIKSFKGFFSWKFSNIARRTKGKLRREFGWLPGVSALATEPHPRAQAFQTMVANLAVPPNPTLNPIGPQFGGDPGDAPLVSIIIPVYNQYAHTAHCLNTLAMQECDFNFEIIVMDDGSSDETQEQLSALDWITYVRNPENLGFVRNCNAGAARAKGEYVLFLNNDTAALPGYLTQLVKTFDTDPNIAIAGSKLLFGDGKLQEVGGIIFDDASGWNWGRGEDPLHPFYNYSRDVDYVSGASLMIRHKVLKTLGYFDERFVPAYYEDTSLCFAARAHGYRVVCNPHSELLHFEGVSNGTDLSQGVKKHQVENRQKFLDLWQETLASHELSDKGVPFAQCDRQVKGHIVIVDDTIPRPDTNAGALNIVNIAKVLIQLGYRCHFVPADMDYHLDYTTRLEALGVVCPTSHHYASPEQYLESLPFKVDHIILSRVDQAQRMMPFVKQHFADATIIFYTVDLHYLREGRVAERSGLAADIAKAEATKAREIQLFNESDASILLSTHEHKILSHAGAPGLFVLPLVREPVAVSTATYAEREAVGFLGGYRHPPNVEAVEWIIDEVWPRVQSIRKNANLRPIQLLVGGSNMPADLAERVNNLPHAKTLGFIASLESYYNDIRLSIAPLLTGAGLKGKVAESFSYGVPVVGTSVALEGMPQIAAWNFESPEAYFDDAQAFAQAVSDQFDDQEGWNRKHVELPQYADLAFGLKGAEQVLANILETGKRRQN